MALWWQEAEGNIILNKGLVRTVKLFRMKECKFPAAANSWGTHKSFLWNWNSIISIHSFLLNGVCENTQISVEHTQTHAHTCRGLRWETTWCPCLQLCSGKQNSCRLARARWRSVVGKWDGEMLKCQSGVCWSEWKRLVELLLVQVAVGKQEVGRSNWCHIIPRESPKSMGPLWRT